MGRHALPRGRNGKNGRNGGRMAVIAVPVVAAMAMTATSASAANGLTAADKAMATKLNQRVGLAHLGSNVVGEVRDVVSGQTVWSKNRTTGLMPASTNKLATAVAALTVLGPDHTVQTKAVYRSGTVYLVGGGDQQLGSADLKSLATAAAKALKAKNLHSVRLMIDDHLFAAPSLATGWNSGYYPDTVAPVRALRIEGNNTQDTALTATTYFAQQLTAQGITVGKPARANAPSGSTVLATHTSKALSTTVEYMLKHSDNDIAEGLLRLTALGQGRAATFAGGTAAVHAVLVQYGIPLTGVKEYDGSGLSRSDRMTADALSAIAALAVDTHHQTKLWPILQGLPVAGVDGTLSTSYGRFTTAPASCAVGKVDAKTGSLHDVSALAGVAKGADGRWKSFAFVENGVAPTATVTHGLDGLAATVEGCW
ncbi:D-alanyl-D-alanine carboxypeptidase/D-alanyl-D-alanine-endopeptidase [Streptomyces sp. NPDC050508]|uniref:D-alanyl-D-alanine carboxypeptidase/D-alanyl-D-alanine endopeptidase n=1 Tax=Streptomyces sp. NPDC050508 TaxID=3155405 RepID=UPI0034442D97